MGFFPAVSKLEESFRTGIHEQNAPADRDWLEMIPRVCMTVWSIDGCRCGLWRWSGGTLAQTYPATTFVGYDTSDVALERAGLAEAGLGNVRVTHVDYPAIRPSRIRRDSEDKLKADGLLTSRVSNLSNWGNGFSVTVCMNMSNCWILRTEFNCWI